MAGPSIARAEVTVDLDGKNIPAEAKLLGEESGAAMGDAHSKEFNDRATKGVDEFGKSAEEDLRKHGKTSGDGFGSELESALAPSLERARKDLSVPFQEAGGEIRTLGADVRSLGGEFDGLGAHVATVGSPLESVRSDISRLGGELDGFGTHVDGAKTHIVNLGDSFTNVGTPVSRLEGYLRRLGVGVTDAEKPLKDLGAGIGGVGGEADRLLVRLGRAPSAVVGAFRSMADGTIRQTDRLAVGVDRATTKTLHFFESFVSGAAKTVAVDTIKGIGAAVDTLGKKLSFTTPLLGAFGTALSGGGGAAGAGGLLAIGIGLLIGFLPQLAVLAGAAAGGLLILGGATAALALAAGGLFIAFKGILQPINTLAPSIQPAAKAIRELVGGFDQVGKKLVFVPGAIQNVKTALQGNLFKNLAEPIRDLSTTLIPELVKDMGGLGTTLNTVIRGFTKDLASSGFGKDLKAIFSGSEPVIIDLGNIARNTFGIIGQLLIDVLPSVHQFTGDIATATGTFLDFLKSPEGKHAVQNFLNDAKKTLKEVGDVLVTTGAALGALITPENVKNTITDLNNLGKAAVSLTNFSDKISPITTALVVVVGTLVDFAAKAATAFNSVLTTGDQVLVGFQLQMSGMISAAINAGKAIGSAVGGIARGIAQIASGDVAGGIKTIHDGLTAAGSDFKKLGSNIAAAAGNASAAFDTLPAASKRSLDSLAGQLKVSGGKTKEFGGLIATISAASGVSIGTIAKAKGWGDLASITGLSAGYIDGLRKKFESTQSASSAALAKLASAARSHLTGVDASMGATGKANDVLRRAFVDQAAGSKSALQGLASAKSYGDIQRALGLTGKVSKTEMADRIEAAAIQSGVSINKLPPVIQALIAKYGLIPKSKTTDVKQNGAQAAQTEVAALKAEIDRLQSKDVFITTHFAQTGTKNDSGITSAAHAAGGLIDGLGNNIRALAFGGFVSSPTWFGNALAGESGLEAIVPLSKPLNQVDPSVRALAEFAQGMHATTNKGSYVAAGAVQIITPASDPAIVAQQVIDRLVPQL